MASFYICAFTAVFGLVYTLYNQNINLSYYSQLLVMPVFLCSVIIGTLLSGCFILGEFKYYNKQELWIIAVGNSISIIGIIYKVCVLEAKDLEKTEDEKNEEENTIELKSFETEKISSEIEDEGRDDNFISDE
jgi:hypothetical protein